MACCPPICFPIQQRHNPPFIGSQNHDDPDGYGSATFNEVLNRLRGLYEKMPEGS